MTTIRFSSRFVPLDDYIIRSPGKYADGTTVLELYNNKTGEPAIRLTVSVPQATILPGQIIIKNYSENTNAYIGLYEAGVVNPPADIFTVGHTAQCVVTTLTEDYKWLMD